MQASPSQNASLRTREMPEREFKRFSELIYGLCGIRLTPMKRTMLTGRLMKRMRILDIDDFGRYFEHVTSTKGRAQELHHMIDVVTTNKTDFFRERTHFDILVRDCLPRLLSRRRKTREGGLRLWSAACSTGEEPYTLAMVMEDQVRRYGNGLTYEVLATDISTRVLDAARRAVYDEERIEPVPPPLKRAYLLRGKGGRKGFVRVVPELRKRVRFERLNLLDPDGFGLKTGMEVVFCRNVIIYFDRRTQERLFRRIYDQIVPGGYLFIGHSETLHGIHDGFIPAGTSVYRKPG